MPRLRGWRSTARCLSASSRLRELAGQALAIAPTGPGTRACPLSAAFPLGAATSVRRFRMASSEAGPISACQQGRVPQERCLRVRVGHRSSKVLGLRMNVPEGRFIPDRCCRAGGVLRTIRGRKAPPLPPSRMQRDGGDGPRWRQSISYRMNLTSTISKFPAYAVRPSGTITGAPGSSATPAASARLPPTGVTAPRAEETLFDASSSV
jgi:hypothetical protein